MNKKEYEEYQEKVKAFFKNEGLHHWARSYGVKI